MKLRSSAGNTSTTNTTGKSGESEAVECKKMRPRSGNARISHIPRKELLFIGGPRKFLEPRMVFSSRDDQQLSANPTPHWGRPLRKAVLSMRVRAAGGDGRWCGDFA